MNVSRNGVYRIYDRMHVAFPRIIPRIMPPNHTRESYPWFWSHVLKHAGYYYGIGKLWWSLFCGSKLGVYVYLLACWPCLSRYGRSQGCQTMPPEWASTQDVHLFCYVFDKALFFFIFAETVSCPSHAPNHTRYIIPRIIPKPRFAVPWPSRPLQKTIAGTGVFGNSHMPIYRSMYTNGKKASVLQISQEAIWSLFGWTRCMPAFSRSASSKTSTRKVTVKTSKINDEHQGCFV